MYDFLKTPEQCRRKNRNVMIIMGIIFGGAFLLSLICIAFGGEVSSTSSSRRCSTVTEPYSNAEHVIECEGDYDWIDERLQMEADLGREYEEDMEWEYENRKLNEELERLDAEYRENYCNENPYECS